MQSFTPTALAEYPFELINSVIKFEEGQLI